MQSNIEFFVDRSTFEMKKTNQMTGFYGRPHCAATGLHESRQSDRCLRDTAAPRSSADCQDCAAVRDSRCFSWNKLINSDSTFGMYSDL
jgi:hypothetical protein